MLRGMDSAWGKPPQNTTGRTTGPGVAPETRQAIAARLNYLRGQVKTLGTKPDYIRQEHARREVLSLTTAANGPDAPVMFLQRSFHAAQALQEVGPTHIQTLTARLRAAQALVATGETSQRREELAVPLADHIRGLGSAHPSTDLCREVQLPD